MEQKNNDLKIKEEEVRHYQKDNLRLSNKLFEAMKKIEDTKDDVNNFEINKSKIQTQINNLNKIISKTNIEKKEFNQIPENQSSDINPNKYEEKIKSLDEIDDKTKDIFVN